MRLYVETGFAIGIAKGQDPDAAALLEEAPGTGPPIQLVVPSVCVMEAFSLWESERKQYNNFQSFINSQIREVTRDVISARARTLAGHLLQSKGESEARFNEMRERLNEALFRLTENAETIAPDTEMIRDSLMNAYLGDPTDNLILCCILRHAHLFPARHAAFFSANRNDFGQQQVGAALEGAGVKYFPSLRNAINWLQSRSAAGPSEQGG